MTALRSLGTGTALGLVAIVLIVAIAGGAVAGRIARPAPPTPIPTPEPTLAPPTPEPDTAPLVFALPLTAGCATDDATWVVSDGGGIGRFDGTTWRLADPTLRSLVAAACASDTVLAIGPAGRVLTIDDRAKAIRADDLGIVDLFGISLLPDGSLVVGAGGAVLRQTANGWQPYARGLEEDLFGVVGFSATSAWTVGSNGAAFRLEDAGWRQFATGTTVTLRAVAASSANDAVAAGDGGTVLRFDGRWRPLDTGVKTDLRAAVRVGQVTYVAGDDGVVLAVRGNDVTRLDLGTTCSLRGAFAKGDDLWLVGSSGTRAAVWRKTGDGVQRWGDC